MLVIKLDTVQLSLPGYSVHKVINNTHCERQLDTQSFETWQACKNYSVDFIGSS